MDMFVNTFPTSIGLQLSVFPTLFESSAQTTPYKITQNRYKHTVSNCTSSYYPRTCVHVFIHFVFKCLPIDWRTYNTLHEIRDIFLMGPRRRTCLLCIDVSKHCTTSFHAGAFVLKRRPRGYQVGSYCFQRNYTKRYWCSVWGSAAE